jgi:hypothetical protein
MSRAVWTGSSGRRLFRHGSAWRIGPLLPTVRIGGAAASCRAIVNGRPAFATALGRWLFLSASYGWVVADEAEEPREFDYTVEDENGDPETILAGTEFWAGTLPQPNAGAASFSPRGSLRDGGSAILVEVTWDYWERTDSAAGGESAVLPHCGAYSPQGGATGTKTVGYPCWYAPDAAAGDPPAFLRAGGLLYRGNAPGAAAAKSGGFWVYGSDESGAWKTASDPAADVAWTIPYVYDDGWDGERPDVASVVLPAGRCLRFREPGLAEYLFPAPRIP